MKIFVIHQKVSPNDTISSQYLGEFSSRYFLAVKWFLDQDPIFLLEHQG